MASHVATNLIPANSATGVARTSTIKFTAPSEDNSALIDVDFTYGAGAPFPVVTAGVAEPGYAVGYVQSGADLDVTITPAAVLPAKTLVTVDAFTPDDAYTNTYNLHLSQLRFVSIPNMDVLSGSAWTFHCLWYPGNVAVSTIIAKSANAANVNQNYFALNCDTSGRLIITLSADNITLYTWRSALNVFAAANTQYWITIVYDGATLVAELNNVVLTPASTTGSLPASIGAFTNLLLKNNVGTGTTDFYWDQVAAWNTAFTAGQRADLYNSGETANLADGTHSYPTPILWMEMENNLNNSGAGTAGPGVFAGSGGSSPTDYGHETSPVVAGQDSRNLDSTWSFTTKGKAGAQVSIHC